MKWLWMVMKPNELTKGKLISVSCYRKPSLAFRPKLGSSSSWIPRYHMNCQNPYKHFIEQFSVSLSSRNLWSSYSSRWSHHRWRIRQEERMALASVSVLRGAVHVRGSSHLPHMDGDSCTLCWWIRCQDVRNCARWVRSRKILFVFTISIAYWT